MSTGGPTAHVTLGMASSRPFHQPVRLGPRLASCFALTISAIALTSASAQVTERQPGQGEIAPPPSVIPPDQVFSAVAEARRTIREHRDSAEAYLRLGTALRSGGNAQGALDAINLALSLDPTLSAAWLQKGLIATDGSTLKAATDDFRRAVEANPKSISARLELASMLFRNGDFDSASREIRAVLQIDAENANAFDGLGFLQLQHGDLRAAA